MKLKEVVNNLFTDVPRKQRGTARKVSESMLWVFYAAWVLFWAICCIKNHVI